MWEYIYILIAGFLSGLRVWRTNPGSVFDYDPAEDNIQSRSLHMINGTQTPRD